MITIGTLVGITVTITTILSVYYYCIYYNKLRNSYMIDSTFDIVMTTILIICVYGIVAIIVGALSYLAFSHMNIESII
jgi:hypothetical protein